LEFRQGRLRVRQTSLIEQCFCSQDQRISARSCLALDLASRPASLVEASAAFQGEVEPRSERKIIEAALAESGGRVSGPSGAAAKLGIPPSTLDLLHRR
jgi:transcriptional regulator with GAF, ATPase, and Fis domain